jgi:hypothetical protein
MWSETTSSGNPKGKSGGGGNFNDMTMDLLDKKDDYDVVCSLYYKTDLVYIVEFPFSIIKQKLIQPVLKAKAGRRVVCNFRYNDYDSDELKIHYLNTSLLNKCLSKPHATMLIDRNNEKTN